MGGMGMYAADMNLKANGMESQVGLWLMAIFLFGLAAMAWLTVRETSQYETRSAIRNLKRNRKHRFPDRERLSLHSRLNLYLRGLIRGGDILDPFQDVLGDGKAEYEAKLRREIDKLVGKEIYHGRKEQLKPPTRPTSD